MSLTSIELTTALRPSLLPDETLLFVQDSVGLYEGRTKLQNYQNGHAYLTSHRACYVDNEEPRKHSVAVHLKDVERPELYAGFWKSSAKVTLYPKASKRASLSTQPALSSHASPSSTPPARHGSPLRPTPAAPPPPASINATWICSICSFSNPLPSNFDPALANANTPLPPCLACGIKPSLAQVVKAALTAMRSQSSSNPAPDQAEPEHDSFHPSTNPTDDAGSTKKAGIVCPRCTFENHPSLNSCEMCGSSLGSSTRRPLELRVDISPREQSPDPALGGLAINDGGGEAIKFSFRVGGDKTFYERLRNALVQRKWLLHSAPPVPKPNPNEGGPGSNADSQERQKVGIAGLERRGLEMRMNNEMVLGNAFEDLEALMTSAKEVAALAENLAAQNDLASGSDSTEASALLSQSANALGLVTTKDMLSSGTSSESLYASELARNLAEFLTDDTKGILKKEGGIMSLVDLWAVFNRARGGVELISPVDFEKAAQLWDKLKLPVRLRRFKSGLLVVQGRDRTDEKTVVSLLAWLREFHIEEPEEDCPWDWRLYGRGVTAQETAERFSWSVGVATEELEMAEERGALCREQGLDGVKFWENWLAHHSDLGYGLDSR